MYENTDQGAKYTRTYNGPFTALFALAPARLARMADLPSYFRVDTVRIQKGKGASGTMTVTLTTNPSFGVTSDETPEVEWIEIQKRLECHPMFNETSTDSWHPNAGKYSLSSVDHDHIEEWKSLSKATERGAYYTAYIEPYSHIKAFVDRLIRGQDSYVDYVPHCRLTSRNATRPANARCGYIDVPPDSVIIDGFGYLKTADRGQNDQNWTRVREWTGADFIDTEVYATT
jgi:hypothetical protein